MSWARRMEPSWPPSATRTLGPFTLREGGGGGQRVSAATLDGVSFGLSDLKGAEAAMPHPLFLIEPGQEALDAALSGRGYQRHDPVEIWRIDAADLTPPDSMAAFAHWPPLSIAIDLWEEGGIGAGRLSVMARAGGPKAVLLGRAKDRAAGVAFVAMGDGGTGCLHALTVRPEARRRGLGAQLIRAAADFVAQAGGGELALAVTEANLPARALYDRLGFSVAGRYHYRILGPEGAKAI